MGFNGVRKHQKIEDPRYLYWADRAGPAGLGGDAQRLPLHAARRSSGSSASGPRRSTATTAIPASSPGCRSTSPGACRTCPTARPQRHCVAGALPPDQDARPDAAGDRQRRLGERRHRHHRHPRLRRRPELASGSGTGDHEDIPTILRRVRPGGRLSTLGGHEHCRAAGRADRVRRDRLCPTRRPR